MRTDIYRQIDVTREVDQIDATPSPHGHTAKTLVNYDNLRVVLIVMQAGSRIPSHQTKGCISIHAVRGRIRVRVEQRAFELGVGSLLALDQEVPHDVDALEESAFLLTIGRG